MSSQETPGAASSRGTALTLEATTGTGNLGNQIEDFDNALGQTTARDLNELDFLQEIDPAGDYKVQVSGSSAAPQHDLPDPPVPDLASRSELYEEITGEIVAQYYEVEFQRLEAGKAHACEDDLEDYNCTTDDEDSSSAF